MNKVNWQADHNNNFSREKLSDILNSENLKIGEIIEYGAVADAQADQLTLDILLTGINNTDWKVITSGWHTWSGSVTRGKDVGIGDFASKFNKNKTEFVVEPGMGGEVIPKGEGVSYGVVTFRHKDGLQNITVGIIPSLKEIEDIRFKLDDDIVKVTLRKELEKLNKKRKVSFKVFLAKGKYTDIVKSYAQELEKLNTLKLMNDKVFWFSWAAYGKGVRQIRDIEPELPYLAEVGVYGLIIDDGWEKVVGQWEVDTDKFPDIIGLIENMKRLGIKPGIWIAPFMVMRETEIYRLHPEWIVKDKHGNVLNVTNPQVQPTGHLRPFVERAIGLDISFPEIREYIYAEFVRLTKIGFEIFKVDFISIPFVGELANKDKTSVEYYREFFIELRQKIKESTGKNVEFIGCGAPMLESIGLFEGIRVSADSAWPNIATLRYYGRLFRIFSAIPGVGRAIKGKMLDIHGVMYKDAAAVAFRRALIFGKALGLCLDGIHLNDPAIPIDPAEKQKVVEALPAFKWMGVLTNLFIGDSLVRGGLKGRLEWQGFLTRFKKGQQAWVEEQTGNVMVEG